VRRELGLRTIFNLLGPLTNPASAPYQLIRRFSQDCAGARRASGRHESVSARPGSVRGDDGLDEVTLSGRTEVFACGQDQMQHFYRDTRGLWSRQRRRSPTSAGGDADANAASSATCLSGSRTMLPETLFLGQRLQAAFRLAGRRRDLKEGVAKALATIEVGRGLAKDGGAPRIQCSRIGR
jgi:anthranilate phosphoribosyltransferase